jgi:hypothetical protein
MVVVALTVRNEQTLADFMTEAGERSSTFVMQRI